MLVTPGIQRVNGIINFLQTQFDITVASEIMAILALTTDLQDMRKRFVFFDTISLSSARDMFLSTAGG